MPNIVYVGGAGFIGSKVVKLLIKQSKKNKITVLDNISTGAIDDIPKSANKIIGDVKSFRSISSLFASRNYDIVVIGCGPIGSIENPSMAYEAYDKNVIGMLNICRNLSLIDVKPKRVVFLSSSSIYGAGAVINEATLPNPSSQFSQAFTIAEDILRLNCKLLGINYLNVRLPEVYGRTNSTKDFISFCVNNFLNKEPFTIPGDNTTIRDFAYVDEVAKHLATIILDESITGELNVGGQPINIAALLVEISKKLEIDVNLVKFNTPPGYIFNTLYADYSLLNSKGIKFEVMVRDVIDGIIKDIKKFREEFVKKLKMLG